VNLLELCLSPGRGGMELYLYRTVQALRVRHNVLPVVSDVPGLVSRLMDEEGIAYDTLRVGLPELPLLAARSLARTIDDADIDAVHVHWRRDLPVAALAKRFSRRRPFLAYTIQMKVSHSKRDPYHNYIYGQVDRFITITDQLREQVREKLHPRFHNRVQRLYYGTPSPTLLDEPARDALRREHGLDPQRFTVGLFGQKHEGKGQMLLVEAMGRLKREGVAVSLLLVGPPVFQEDDDMLRAAVRANGLEEETRLIEYVRTPQELMQVCDVVVLATWQETFGLVLIEAMSVGTAVIGSDAGGVREIITHGDTGLLFETKNVPDLHRQLAALQRMPDKRARLAVRGQARARKVFDLDRHYAALEAILKGEAGY